jgi:membrane protein DedA with SNARE-associated domain
MGLLASAIPTVASGIAPLPGFLNSLTGPLDHFGYGAIALLLLLENIGVPVVPGELALIGGAIFAGTGRAGLNVVLVGVVGVIVTIAGAEIGYLIGKYAGRELVLRYGKYVLIKPHHLDRAEAIVSDYGGIVVIVARFIVGLREANGIIAGITRMRWLTFSIFNVIGACAWVATWVTLGDVAGDHIATVYADINRYFLYLLIAVGVLLVAYIGRRLLRRRRAGRPHEVREEPEEPEEPEAQDEHAAHEAPVAQEGPAPAPTVAHEEPGARETQPKSS